MILPDVIRQRIGALTPLERAEKDHNEQAAAYYKEQRELIADQKEYGRTIKTATVVMAVASAIMALAMIIQIILMPK